MAPTSVMGNPMSQAVLKAKGQNRSDHAAPTRHLLLNDHS
jgi:hypothetical protein